MSIVYEVKNQGSKGFQVLIKDSLECSGFIKGRTRVPVVFKKIIATCKGELKVCKLLW